MWIEERFTTSGTWFLYQENRFGFQTPSTWGGVMTGPHPNTPSKHLKHLRTSGGIRLEDYIGCNRPCEVTSFKKKRPANVWVFAPWFLGPENFLQTLRPTVMKPGSLRSNRILRGGSSDIFPDGFQTPNVTWGGVICRARLGGGLKHFFFSPRSLGKWSNLTIIFFRWVETTN